jgi:hypothetical protein
MTGAQWEDTERKRAGTEAFGLEWGIARNQQWVVCWEGHSGGRVVMGLLRQVDSWLCEMRAVFLPFILGWQVLMS